MGWEHECRKQADGMPREPGCCGWLAFARGSGLVCWLSLSQESHSPLTCLDGRPLMECKFGVSFCPLSLLVSVLGPIPSHQSASHTSLNSQTGHNFVHISDLLRARPPWASSRPHGFQSPAVPPLGFNSPRSSQVEELSTSVNP